MRSISTAAAVLFVLSGFVMAQKPAGTSAVSPPSGVLTVDVENGKTLQLTQADLDKLPRKEFHGVDHDGKDSVYSGVELSAILELAGAKFGEALRGPAVAQYLFVGARDGYHAVYALAELDAGYKSTRIILADHRDGKPLAADIGPWQIIVQDEKKHARWVRQVSNLSVRMAK